MKPLPMVKGEMLFDSWPKGTKVVTGICCRRRRDPSVAKLRYELEVVPVSKTTDGTPGTVDDPVGAGREGPKPLPEPTSRVTLMRMAMNPVRGCKIMLGPDKCNLCLCTCVMVILVVIAVVAVMTLAQAKTLVLRQ